MASPHPAHSRKRRRRDEGPPAQLPLDVICVIVAHCPLQSLLSFRAVSTDAIRIVEDELERRSLHKLNEPMNAEVKATCTAIRSRLRVGLCQEFADRDALIQSASSFPIYVPMAQWKRVESSLLRNFRNGRSVAEWSCPDPTNECDYDSMYRVEVDHSKPVSRKQALQLCRDPPGVMKGETTPTGTHRSLAYRFHALETFRRLRQCALHLVLCADPTSFRLSCRGFFTQQLPGNTMGAEGFTRGLMFRMKGGQAVILSGSNFSQWD